MSQFLDQIIERAKQDRQTIVLPEGNDVRTLEAARMVLDKGIADVVILGKQEEISAHGVDVSGATVIDPAASPLLPAYAEKLAELRAKKGMTLEQATELCKDVSYYGVMMVYMGDADGMVSGAINTTAHTIRPALQFIKTKPGFSVVSSCFLMCLKDRVLVFGDCAVNPNPNAQQLAEIAISTAETARAIAGIEPRVAMLSFSTKGSAKHELVDKVQEATRIAKELAPELQLDGELQADAALVESVAKTKAPGSPVAGKANVLVFPDLQAGNIGYKLVERFSGADAVGPILQGIAAPVNDLSRGCKVQDIVQMVVITANQAIK